MFLYFVFLISCLSIKPVYTSKSINLETEGNKLYRMITVYPSLDSFPEDSTVFSVGFVKDSFVVHVMAYQKEKIAASILKNDQEDIMNDDWILVMLDTEGKSNSAYCFQANPRGTKRDFMLSQGGR